MSRTVDEVFRLLSLDPLSEGLQIVPAARLMPQPQASAPEDQPLDLAAPALDRLVFAPQVLDPTQPVLVCAQDAEEAATAKAALLQLYPADHQVRLVDRQKQVHDLPLSEVGDFAYLSLPPMPALGDLTSFDTLRYIVARLRGPGGCPWDREQTHASLKPYLIEEAYEALEALEAADAAKLQEELGDLLLQVVLHAQLAAEAGRFSIAEVIQTIAAKLLRRHPHVFGETRVADAAEVLHRWDEIKRAEVARGDSLRRGVGSLLNGVPKAMPALAYAQAIQGRAARVGFDWPAVQGVLEKVAEEARELEGSPDKAAELGDLLFALVNLGRWLKVDAEEALRAANQRFYRRFTWMEQQCAAQGTPMDQLSLAALDALWEQAKRQSL